MYNATSIYMYICFGPKSFLIIGGVAGIHADVQRYTWPLAFWVSFVKGAARRLSVIMLILIFKESSI